MTNVIKNLISLKNKGMYKISKAQLTNCIKELLNTSLTKMERLTCEDYINNDIFNSYLLSLYANVHIEDENELCLISYLDNVMFYIPSKNFNHIYTNYHMKYKGDINHVSTIEEYEKNNIITLDLFLTITEYICDIKMEISKGDHVTFGYGKYITEFIHGHIVHETYNFE